MIFNASGAFTQPFTPDYPGVQSYKGKYIHCVEWDDHVPLEGKRVAIIGSGPTAIQVVSQVAAKVGHIDIYQRTPNWIMPNPNVPFSEEQKEIWRQDPEALKAKRQQLMDASAQTWAMIEAKESEGQEALKKVVIANYHKVITKPGVIEKITPNYRGSI